MAAVVRALSLNPFSTLWSRSQKVTGPKVATSPWTQNLTANLLMRVSTWRELTPTQLLAMPRSLLPGATLKSHLLHRGSAPAGLFLKPNGSVLAPGLTSASDPVPTCQSTLQIPPPGMSLSGSSAARSLTDPAVSLLSSCPTIFMLNSCRKSICFVKNHNKDTQGAHKHDEMTETGP